MYFISFIEGFRKNSQRSPEKLERTVGQSTKTSYSDSSVADLVVR